MVLIAYHMLGSSTCAYIGWLVKELQLIANKTKYNDAHLVMLPADAITHKLESLANPWSLFFPLTGKSCEVQLSTQGLFYPIAGDRNFWS
jgi:hypothetical protein